MVPVSFLQALNSEVVWNTFPIIDASVLTFIFTNISKNVASVLTGVVSASLISYNTPTQVYPASLSALMSSK